MRSMRTLVFGLIMISTQATLGAVTEEEVERLGNDLTPVGAELLGNGSDIPAWDGGLAKRDDLAPGQFHPDPYPN